MRSNLLKALAAIAFAVGTGAALAQAQPTGKDKEFLKDTAQDSAFEIKTGQLALQKSKSADVRAYATMLIHDHLELEQQVKAVDALVSVTPPSPDSMSISDNARYAELKLLSGDSFDKSYIKGLVKGNRESIDNGKSEAAGTSVSAIKTLAEKRVALDTKHTERAEALAQAHHIDAQ